MNVSVETRSYMSAQHLWAAQHYVRLAQDFERERAGAEGIFIRHRSYVFTAVSEAVAFLEAFINEVFRDAAQNVSGEFRGSSDAVRRAFGDYWKDHEQDRTLTKYGMARLLAGAQRLDMSHRPNDDVTHVIKLRNWSVHYRPRTLSVTAQEGLLDHVRGRFGDTPFLGLGEANWWFPDHALSASCAEWAVTSSVAFVREFVTDLGITTSLLDLVWEEAP